jgi:tetratricopeptide (TPR) repeat protein
MKQIHCVSLAVVGLALGLARAQEPDVVVLRAPKPPAVLLKDNVARIRVDLAKDSVRHAYAPALKIAVEQALKSDFVLSDSKPDAILTVGIASFVAPAGRESVETRQCKDLRSFGGRPDRCVTNSDSFWLRTIKDYNQQVKYWHAAGALSLNVKLVDQKNSIEDNFSPTYRLDMKVITSVDGKPLGKKVLATNAELLNTLLEGAAHAVKGQYAFGFEERSVALPVEKELDLGNGYATAGDWKAAAASWEQAGAGKRDLAADRLFSLGVAQEAQAYENYASTRTFDDPRKMLEKAGQYYKESLTASGKDRVRQQRAQLGLVAVPKSIINLDELKKLQMIREIASQQTPEAPVAGPGGKSVDLGTPEARKFRELIERQITAIPEGKVSKEQEERWAKLGETGFRVPSEGAKQIVEQVVAARKDLLAKIGQYRDSLLLYLSDKNISKSERADLKTLQEALQLTPEAVAEVENKLRPFSEEGVTPAVTPPPPEAPPVRQRPGGKKGA